MMMAWMLVTFLVLNWATAHSAGCNLERLRESFAQSTTRLPQRLQSIYQSAWRIDVAAVESHLQLFRALQTCEMENRIEPLTSCRFNTQLERSIGFGNAVRRGFDIYVDGNQCAYLKGGLEFVTTPKHYIAYGFERLWRLGTVQDQFCQNKELKQTQRYWVATGRQSDVTGGLFLVDYPYPDNTGLPDSMFWGRKVVLKENPRLDIVSPSADRIRFLWANGSYVELNTESSLIEDSNFLSPRMYSDACRTLTERRRFIPEVQIRAEGLGLVEKVEDISP